MPTTSNNNINRRRRLPVKLFWWKPAISPTNENRDPSHNKHGSEEGLEVQLQPPDIGTHTEDSSSVTSESPPPPPQDPFTAPQEWIVHYRKQLQNTRLHWTERANLQYRLGHLYAQCHEYEPATTAFEEEAHILQQQQHAACSTLLVPIYQTLAKLWEVRQPRRALQYYETALRHADDADERQALRHAMGRLYFQTGNLERAVQVSIGKR